MPKVFYTEDDIDDLVERGVPSLRIDANVVLTDLAYERAARLGLKLVRDDPNRPAAAAVPAAESDLQTKIRNAVLARMGNRVDPALLDTIIRRVLISTGAK